jgi:hypothetical protein
VSLDFLLPRLRLTKELSVTISLMLFSTEFPQNSSEASVLQPNGPHNTVAVRKQSSTVLLVFTHKL